MIRAVIVDDEPYAREGLRLRCAREPDVEVVGEAGDGRRAVQLVRRVAPDLLFLDVQMPGLDGFDTLALLAEGDLPLVVFVTAYDSYAVKAFEANALDYLMKPVDDDRFSDSIRRVRRQLEVRAGTDPPPQGLAQLLDVTSAPALQNRRPSSLRRFLIRERGHFRFLPVEKVQWVRSAANYVELHTERDTHLVRMTMAEAEARLFGHGFVRIHRTVLLRAMCVAGVAPTEHGDFNVRLESGQELPMSRRYRRALLDA